MTECTQMCYDFDASGHSSLWSPALAFPQKPAPGINPGKGGLEDGIIKNHKLWENFNPGRRSCAIALKVDRKSNTCSKGFLFGRERAIRVKGLANNPTRVRGKNFSAG